jgi:hypothetical protein
MARSFSCTASTALCNLTFAANTTTFPVGSTVTFGTAQTWICDITGEPPGTCGTSGAAQTCLTSKCNYSWTSDSLTSISGPNNTPTVSLTGVTPGTSNVNANVLDRQTACQYGIGPTATVRPTVSISGPSYVPLRTGASTGPNSMTLSATVNPSGGTYSWTTSSNKVSLSKPLFSERNRHINCS